MFCTVVTSSRSSGIGNGLTYESQGKEVLGSAVRVPLRNKMVEGIIVEVKKEQEQKEYDMRKIEEILDVNPLLTEAQIKTAQWMAQYYITTLRQALSVWIPPPPWSRVLPKELIGYKPGSVPLDVLRGKRQMVIAEYVMGKDWVSQEELRRAVGAAPEMLRQLKKKGVIIEERRREAPAEPHPAPINEMPSLTPAQEAAVEFIQKDDRPALLFGVTGSGKTEIYAQLIAQAIRDGKQAILLVPEILLTEHSIARFERLLKREAISVIHSKLTQKARRDEWKRIRSGAVSLVIGSRSALFAPVRKPGCIILDEEHEWTYKNEQTPRYHARDTAEVLARNNGAKLVLGSATPSLESWARAKNGAYNLVRLPLRFQDQPMPTVRVVDLADVKFGKLYPFTPPLIEAIGERLKRGEQSVLFLNRRGIASALLCLKCRRRVVCAESQLPFTVHNTSHGRPYLMDHSTGIIAEVPAVCPHCASTELKAVGAGTQRIEAILQSLFPQARLIRADRDTMQDPVEMRAILSAMRERKADILLGTQAVVKGLDLPGVTLAAVLLADLGLSLPHFRAGERVFQLLTQLTGRSGRALPGEVIIQTFRPDSPEVLAASKHETEKYLNDELKLRIYGEYPPAADMIRFLVRTNGAERRAKRLFAEVQKAIAEERCEAKVYVSPTFFGGNREWHVLVRGSSLRPLLRHVDLTDVSVDVDPMETL
jgi:primosomal protein N' (replication factor Y)